MAEKPNGDELYDGIFSVEAGFNSGVQPLLVPANQMFFGVNCTVRGTFLTDRPKYRKIKLSFADSQSELFYRHTAQPGDPVTQLGTTSEDFTAPNVNERVTITLAQPYTGPIGTNITVCGSLYKVGPQPPPTGFQGYKALLENVDDTPGNSIASGSHLIAPASSSKSWHIIATTAGEVNVKGPGGSFSNVSLNAPGFPGNNNYFFFPPATVTEFGTSPDLNDAAVYNNTLSSNYATFNAVSDTVKKVRFFYDHTGTGPEPNNPNTLMPVGSQVAEWRTVNVPATDIGTTAQSFTVPASGSTVIVFLNFLYNGAANQPITINGKNYKISTTPQDPPTASTLEITNLGDVPGTAHAAGCLLSSLTVAPSGPPGAFQGACFFNPDSGQDSAMAAIGGRLFQFILTANGAVVYDRTIPNDANPPNQPQAWLWQSEKWTIWNDGVSNPVFFDGSLSTRSNFATGAQSAGVISPNDLVVSTGIGSTITVNLNIDPTGYINVGDTLFVPAASSATQLVLTVTAVGIGSVDGTNTNVNASTSNKFVYAAGLPVSFATNNTQLPPGRMGTYGMGRNWMCLVDGKTFIASDIVGGSSGTQTNQFRDAVLNITENSYLRGGGTFRVPVEGDEITFMRFTATLDASLGQGPLQVGTRRTIFSCNTPVDRLTWTTLTNPILTYSLTANGGLAQDSSINVNGDILFRSLVGLGSLVLGRRDFATWGNVPISREMDRVFSKDDVALLGYGSAIVFQNRYLVTAAPFTNALGVAHSAMVPINFDPLSTLRGKAPSVYDAPWIGLNVLKLIVGQVAGVERAFAFCLDTASNEIVLYEILPDGAATTDEGNSPVIWTFQTGAKFNALKAKPLMEPMRLLDGEIFIEDLIGRADIQAWYRPDSYPCWIPWHHFSICSDPKGKPGYRTRLGLGEPDGSLCEPANDRPYREFYWCQFRFVIQGHLKFMGGRFRGVRIPQLRYARPECQCPPQPPLTNPTIQMITSVDVIGGEGGDVIGGEGGDVVGGS